jgi:hypothetical protein
MKNEPNGSQPRSEGRLASRCSRMGRTSLSTILLILPLFFGSAVALASGDGCELWCGEFPNAYFLAPDNDSRGNLGLLLEDQGVVRYGPKAMPFHYVEFMEPTSPAAAESGNGVSSLAADLGVGGDSVASALQRLGSSGFGRCLTDDAEAVETFLREIKNASLPHQDGMLLAQERLRFAGLCEKAMEGYQPLPVSEAARPYARYLEAAANFYAGQYEPALVQFKALSADAPDWVRETSLYMLGRVALNQAQIRFDEWSEPSAENIDKAFLDRAASAFGDYLKAYPNGRYAESAKGLFRKIHWLAADQAALAADYQRWLAAMGAETSSRTVLDFIDETERKVNPAGNSVDALWSSPVLASLSTLASWRPQNEGEASVPPVDVEMLAAHRGEFANGGLEPLWSYLGLAHAFWVDKNYPELIRQTASDRIAAKPSNLAYSRWVLRGLSLMALRQYPEAERHWLEMLKTVEHPGQKIQAQWLLALTWNEAGRLDSVYAKDSPVALPEIQDYFIHKAKPPLLESLLTRNDLPPHTKSLAYFRLVSQWVRHRDLAAAEQILAAYPPTGFALAQDRLAPLSSEGQKEGYTCPAFKELLAALQKTPDSARWLNCMADFLRTWDWNYPDPVVADENPFEVGAHHWHKLADYGLPTTPVEDAFGGKTYTSMDYYREAIERQGLARTDDDLAYALHRATTCFASSGNNHCGDQDIPKSQRAAWFKRLKTQYKNSPWAKGQKYYW